jgi:hypothetical protein
MNLDAIKENRNSLIKFLEIIYRGTVFNGPILLSKAIDLVAKEMGILRFEALALYYRAKHKHVIEVECLRDPHGSLKAYISITSKGVQTLKEAKINE